MVVYAKRLGMFRAFLIGVFASIFMAWGSNKGFHDIVDYGGIQFPIANTGRVNTGFSWIIWLFCLGGEGSIIYQTFGFMKLWARRTPATMMIINDQGIYLPQLQPGQVIPWADVEGYDMKIDSVGVMWLILKIKNREHYLEKKWWGLYPALKLKIRHLSENYKAIGQSLDEYLRSDPGDPGAPTIRSGNTIPN